MFSVSLGGPYDVAMITNVLHHFSEERATHLLQRAARVMADDGRIVLVGFTTSDAPPAAEASAHLFSILMLIWTHEGEVHSVAPMSACWPMRGSPMSNCTSYPACRCAS